MKRNDEDEENPWPSLPSFPSTPETEPLPPPSPRTARHLEDFHRMRKKRRQEYYKTPTQFDAEQNKEVEADPDADLDGVHPFYSGEEEAWARLLNSFSDLIREIGMFGGANFSTAPTILFLSSDEKKYHPASEWDKYDIIVCITSFDVFRDLHKSEEGDEHPEQQNYLHTALLVFIPKRHLLRVLDTSGWIENVVDIGEILDSKNPDTISNEVRNLILRNFNSWQYEIVFEKVFYQQAQTAPYESPGACGAYACWFALWMALNPTKTYDGENPPPFPAHDVFRFRTFVRECIRRREIFLPDPDDSLTNWKKYIGGKKMKKRTHTFSL